MRRWRKDWQRAIRGPLAIWKKLTATAGFFAGRKDRSEYQPMAVAGRGLGFRRRQ
ncbi:MAG: hypothetical protein WDO73_23190 [Ignavibacteriota bacterium]